MVRFSGGARGRRPLFFKSGLKGVECVWEKEVYNLCISLNWLTVTSRLLFGRLPYWVPALRFCKPLGQHSLGLLLLVSKLPELRGEPGFITVKGAVEPGRTADVLTEADAWGDCVSIVILVMKASKSVESMQFLRVSIASADRIFVWFCHRLRYFEFLPVWGNEVEHVWMPDMVQYISSSPEFILCCLNSCLGRSGWNHPTLSVRTNSCCEELAFAWRGIYTPTSTLEVNSRGE